MNPPEIFALVIAGVVGLAFIRRGRQLGLGFRHYTMAYECEV
jgi:hypothetical protein